MKQELYIVGSGGLGREMLAIFIANEFSLKYDEIYFIDNHQGQVYNIEIIGNNDYLKLLEYKVDVFIAISNCQIRAKIISELRGFNHLNFINFIHPKASLYMPDNIKIGTGCYIGEGCVLTTDIQIGDFCFLNSYVSLHHDTILEENCFLMPGVRITGGAFVGKNSYLGNNFQLPDKINVPANSKLIN